MANGEVAAPGPQTGIDPKLEHRLAVIGQAFRWLAVIYSVIIVGGALFGWFGSNLPEGPPTVRRIAISSAVALVALSLAGLLAGDNLRTVREPVMVRRIGLVMAWLAAAFGAFVMLTYFFDVSWPWWETVNDMPAFAVGVNLLALGVAVPLSVDRNEARVIAGQVATLAVFSLTAVIFLGYLYGEPSVGRLFLQPEISFQAAFGALLIAVGVVLIRPGSGLLSIASSPSLGGRMIRWLGPILLFTPAALLFAVEALPNKDRIDALAFVAVSMGFLLLILLGVIARVVDVTALEASTAQAQADRARAGLDQEAPLVASLAEVFHLVGVDGADAWDVATRFRPGEGAVAGDASAVRSLPDGRLGVVVVDVTGHGVEPALRSVRIRDLLVHSLILGHSPSEALSRVYWWVSPDALATAAVAVLDPRDGRVVLASAGHPPAILVQAQEVSLFGPTGPMLFLNGSDDYSDSEFSLSEGDTVVLFSDGVADVQNLSGGRTEPEQLGDILLAEGGVAARTADLVLGFGEGDPSDDQTVVVVRLIRPVQD